MLKILFFGSSVHSLKIISVLGNQVAGLVSQPDRPLGRKQIITPTPVSKFARENKIPLYNPESLKEKPWEIREPKKLLNFVKTINPDLIIVAYFGQKIPPEVINYPKFGCLNIHPSLLPKFPGSSPAVWAILEGEKETGVTILKMNEKLDKGEIIAQEKEEIKETDTPEDLYERLFAKGAALLAKILPRYLSGEITPKPQGEKTSVYARRLTKEDGKIDWSKSPSEIKRFIRGLSPWPGAWTEVKINGKVKRLKFITPEIVQLEGKKPVSYKEFVSGYPSINIKSLSSP